MASRCTVEDVRRSPPNSWGAGVELRLLSKLPVGLESLNQRSALKPGGENWPSINNFSIKIEDLRTEIKLFDLLPGYHAEIKMGN